MAAAHDASSNPADLHPGERLGSARLGVLGVVLMDAQGVVRGWDAGATEWFGYPAAEAVGRRFHDLLMPEAMAAARGSELGADPPAGWPLPTGKMVTLPVQHGDGNVKVVCVTVVEAELPGERHLLGVLSDPVVHRSPLAGREDVLQVVFERAPEVITVVDRKGVQLTVNEAGARMLGYDSHRFEGEGVGFIHPADAAVVRDHFLRRVRGQRAGHEPVRYRAMAGDGSWRWLESLVGDFTDVPEIDGYIVFSRDVTADEGRREQLRSSQAQLAEALQREREARQVAEERAEELRKVDAARVAFVSSVSHELRTPLTTITSAVELLQEPELDDDERATFLSLVARNSERLGRLVEDLLVVGRIEAGLLRLVPAPVDLPALVREVVADERQSSAARGVRIELRSSAGAALVGDDLRLRQVTHNMVANAVKFSAPGGHVLVTCRSDGQAWHLVVDDAGPGIGAADAEQIFEPFYRLPGAATTAGSGLGLAIVRGLVTLHGGTVTVSSSDLGGARFACRFPLPGAPDVARGDQAGDPPG